MKKIILDNQYDLLLKSMNIKSDEILRKSKLPEDLFGRKSPTLTIEEYYRFMNSLDNLISDEKIPILLATSDSIESFSPPIFAAYCSQNGHTCIKRLAQYKVLIGALKYEITENSNSIAVELKSVENDLELPEMLTGIELVFLINLIRKATKENIIPLNVKSKYSFKNKEYENFIGIEIEKANKNEIIFLKEDLEKPFISRNDSMWEFFEPELNRRLNTMTENDTMKDRVKSAIIELLPTGECSIENVANKLGFSKRTLQRKLNEENTTFQKILEESRKQLTKYYIEKKQMSSEDISYLLGYQDLTSFLRAFNNWYGMSITDYKKNII